MDQQKEKKIVLSLETSADNMTAFLQLLAAAEESDQKLEQLVWKAINERKIKYGLIEENIKTAIVKRNGEKILLARGREPVAGIDACIKYHFEINGLPLTPKARQDGSVDYYNLELIQQVKAGDVLAERVPPVPGQDGMDIYGRVIPAKKAKDVVLKAGKGTRLLQEENIIVAEKNGHVALINGKVTVSDIYEVRGNVDFSTGNIDFDGTIRITGDVLGGFQVKATADVEVGGAVLGGSIQAGGHLRVRNGIIGKKGAQISCQGNLFAAYVENAFIECGGNVQIGKGIMHSQVIAEGSVIVEGSKALIAGGEVRAGRDIRAKTVGAPMGTHTLLEAGVSPKLKLRYLATVSGLTAVQQSLTKAKQIIDLLQRMKEKAGELPDEKKALLIKVKRSVINLEAELKNLIVEEQELLTLLQTSIEGKIMIEKIVHPGTRIVIGDQTLIIDEPVQYVSFQLNQEGEIEMRPLR
ncbi:DUF342 domain-containing protein [Carboxydocella sp. ULO1]|uniref:DUF342 domain-containing protein n=1 Tax=Carboxydocella sp. ULO1 TaxID=1926599 RepID=UPI0009AE8105|nr:FapA family protein [Carboxydocella sp. ULO1]GAW28272.1 hypothetical protein ULO1_08420 [Carboxydocella sp. ULO1]